MLLFLPLSHPDAAVIRRSPRARVLSTEATIPGLIADLGNGMYRPYRTGDGYGKPPIPGILIQVDEEHFSENYSYPYTFSVPVVPIAVATLPSY